MTNNCPGGRPRSSSLGDTLEVDDIDHIISNSLAYKRKQDSKILHLEDDQTSDSGHSELTVDAYENVPSKGKHQTLSWKIKRRSRPSFKSVKSLMSRLIHPGASLGYGVSQESYDTPVFTGARGGMARKEFSPDRYSDQNERFNGLSQQPDSVSQPLVVDIPNWDQIPGTTGIQNHGNTCFMNAVIQCLSNTDSFAEYFVCKQYKNEESGITRKLGWTTPKGEVTEQLAHVLTSLWANKYHAEVSNLFKLAIGRNNEQYKGSCQHDAQEFLLWLLDKLNEELMCSTKKKRKTLSSKLSDTSLSDEKSASEVISQNNGSPVYNMFQALYRSSLLCPSCGKRSNTFESYLCLSLPLPYKVKRPVFVVIAEEIEPDKPVQQTKFGFQMYTHEMVKDLRVKLSQLTGIGEKKWVLCQIYSEGFRNTYSDDQPITDLPCVETDPIYAIETYSSHNNDSGEEQEFEQSMVHIILVNIVKSHKYSRFCAPQILHLPRDISGRDLQKEILLGLVTCLKDGVIIQKLDSLFKLRLEDGSPGKDYLALDVEMPLYTEIVDRALSTYGEDFGPKHIKLVAEWEPNAQHKLVQYDNNKIDIDVTVKEVQQQQQQQQTKVSLEECFKLFTKEEKLTGDAAWLCPHCKRQQQGATKTLALWSIPDILVIHLKRFRQVGQRRNKLNTQVDFPVRGLSMSQYILPKEHQFEPPKQNKTPQLEKLHESQYHDNITYDLYGVCNHYGDMQGGHYTAFCQNPLTEKWFKFDDTKVSEINENEVKTPAAYLLFYKRRGLNSIVKDSLKNHTHWIYSLMPPSSKSQPQNRKLRDRSNSATRSNNPSHAQNKTWTKNSDVALTVKLPSEKNQQRVHDINNHAEHSSDHNLDHIDHGASRDTFNRGYEPVRKEIDRRDSGLWKREGNLRVDIESATRYRSETTKQNQKENNVQQENMMKVKNNGKVADASLNLIQLTSSPKPKIDFSINNEISDKKIAKKDGTRACHMDSSYPDRQADFSHKVVHFEDEQSNFVDMIKNPITNRTVQKSTFSSSVNSTINQNGTLKNHHLGLNNDLVHSSGSSPTYNSPSSHSPQTPSSAGSQSSYNSNGTSTKPQNQDTKMQARPPAIPQRKESLHLSKNRAAQKQESFEIKNTKGSSVRPNSVPAVHNQSRSQVSASTVTVSRQAWSTPQPVRKQAVTPSYYKDDLDNRKPPRPPPPSVTDQLPPKQPQRPPDRTYSVKEYNPSNYTDHSSAMQKQSSSSAPFSSNKSATLGRASTQRHFNNVTDIRPHLAKSTTDSSIRAKQISPMTISKQEDTFTNEARSRKPLCNVDKSMEESSDIFRRFMPHKHYYVQLPKKEMIQDYQKEKMFSPCAKESSV